ncbi:MAG: GntR family transcriptional regulator [Sphingomonadaceae bacterium]|jgi:DNA-binding GntR family transcriptional regulator|nr:GntR family transcriptional regulator [Sphingomonadaceae bacterium]MCP5383355.1 GntR family transcriptional regulator [Altererythrobacter sp.]MCP5391233.1 GntR family transcriptional regulator [Sphingomonadaceae bacterium]MCP5393532.1 GntR family transcriptional regulator [Sphingomonadaceae bacterium]
MNSLANILSPISRDTEGAARRTAIEVYDLLQTSILDGTLPPGTIISQVAIADALQVSRTPVREAMRMLQEAGLLTSEPNYRSRVVEFDPVDLDALYCKRIALESLSVAITTKRNSPGDVAELEKIVTALESPLAHNDFSEWQSLHREFHRHIAKGAGATMVAELEQLEKHSERYQSAYKGAHMAGWWQRGEAEHREILEAIRAGNAALAGELTARHLARTALELMAALSPEYDSSRIRDSLKFAISGGKGLSD